MEVDAGERALDHLLGGVAIVDRLKGAVLEVGCQSGSVALLLPSSEVEASEFCKTGRRQASACPTSV